MAKDTVVTLKQLTGELEKQDKALQKIQKAWLEIEKTIGKVTSEVSGGAGGNRMSNSLAKFSGVGLGMSGAERIGIGLAAIGGIVQTGAGMMPATADVLQRATGYYNAGVMQGIGSTNFSMNQRGMYNRLANGLGKFGIQSPQATQQLAQFYGIRGVTIGSDYEGNLTRAVGGAAQYLNMDSNRAAAALENLTAGAGGQSANMLRQLGIFTADPYTGRVKTQQQLFDEIHTRITAGMPKAKNAAEVQEEYRRGALGYFLKNSGMSEDQQQLFYISELYRAETGKSLDLSNKNQLEAATKDLESKGFINPQESINAIAASEEGVLQKGQASYIAGLQAAVPTIEGLNVVAGQLAESFGGLKAAVDAVRSTNAGGGALGALGGLYSGGLSVIGSFGGGKGPTPPAPGGGAPGGALAKAGTGALKGLGVAGGAIGVAGGSMGAYNSAQQGDALGIGMSILGATVSGALAGSMFGVPGAIIGGSIGLISSGISAIVGGQGGYTPMGGQTQAQGSANTSTSSRGSEMPKWVRPASGPITSKYGPRKPPTAGASSFHRGVDIAAKMGSPIVAAADGKVVFAGVQGGFGNHVRIQHSGGYVSSYSHMSRIVVKVGQQVAAGNQIGACGSTGVSTGAHLHFEIKKDGAHIDPATVVPGLGGAGTATVTNTLASGDAKGDTQQTAADAAGASVGNANGYSALGALLNLENPLNGYAKSKVSDSVSTVPSKVRLLPTKQTSAQDVTMAGPGTTAPGGKGGPANGSSGMITDTAIGTGKNRGVVINLHIQQASEAEAKRFANMVKDILDDESNIKKIGRM